MELNSFSQVGRDPKIIVWETATMQTVRVLRGFHQRAVTLLVRESVVHIRR